MLQEAENKTSNKLRDLTGAFELFNKRSKEIEHAYQALKLRVEQVDAQLERANGELRDKVAQLDHVQGHLRNILQSMADGVMAVDTDGNVTMFNSTAGKMLGINSERAVGRHCGDLLRNCDGSPLLVLETLRAGETFDECRHDVESADGGPRRVVESTTSLIRDTSGAVQGAVEVFRDRTEIEELEQRVFRSDRLARIGGMAADLAHEIRSPLGGIQGFAALLERGVGKADTDRQLRLIKNITKGVSSLNSTVTGMLDFCRDDAFAPRTVKLGTIFATVFGSIQSEISFKGAPPVNMRADLQVDEIEADPEQLRRAFLNLIANAVQSMPDGGTVSVTSRPADDGLVRVTIADTGPGIDPAVRERLFEPFVTGRKGGTGLGLAIVWKIISRHGGTIDAESVTINEDQEHHGTTFTVTLPAARHGSGRTAQAECNAE